MTILTGLRDGIKWKDIKALVRQADFAPTVDSCLEFIKSTPSKEDLDMARVSGPIYILEAIPKKVD